MTNSEKTNFDLRMSVIRKLKSLGVSTEKDLQVTTLEKLLMSNNFTIAELKTFLLLKKYQRDHKLFSFFSGSLDPAPRKDGEGAG
ncbi:MAG: hypothetical protein ACOX6J_05675 [Oscillospiraceae bacterium]